MSVLGKPEVQRVSWILRPVKRLRCRLRGGHDWLVMDANSVDVLGYCATCGKKRLSRNPRKNAKRWGIEREW